MTPRVVVCPPEPALLQRLREATVVLVVDGADAVEDALRVAQDHQVRVRAVKARLSGPVSSLRLPQPWGRTRVDLFAPRLGSVREALLMSDELRKLRGRVMLSTDDPESCTHVRILASLGISCGLWFGSESPDWEALTDLATYALLGMVPHGSIEPFDEIAHGYQSHKRTLWGASFYDDPSTFLHVDAQGRVALTAAGLVACTTLSDSIEDLDAIDTHPAYLAWQDRWKDAFLQAEGCAWCPGWRLCLGRHEERASSGCRDFYTELMSVVEQHQQVRGGGEPP